MGNYPTGQVADKELNLIYDKTTNIKSKKKNRKRVFHAQVQFSKSTNCKLKKYYF